MILMPDTKPLNPAAKNDPFPEWPWGISSDDHREPRCAEPIWIPEDVAVCPECASVDNDRQGRLHAEMEEIGDDGDIRSIILTCEHDVYRTPKTDGDYKHRMWQSDWQGVQVRVKKYLNRTYCWVPSDQYKVLKHEIAD